MRQAYGRWKVTSNGIVMQVGQYFNIPSMISDRQVALTSEGGKLPVATPNQCL